MDPGGGMTSHAARIPLVRRWKRPKPPPDLAWTIVMGGLFGYSGLNLLLNPSVVKALIVLGAGLLFWNCCRNIGRWYEIDPDRRPRHLPVDRLEFWLVTSGYGCAMVAMLVAVTDLTVKAVA